MNNCDYMPCLFFFFFLIYIYILIYISTGFLRNINYVEYPSYESEVVNRNKAAPHKFKTLCFFFDRTKNFIIYWVAQH
jgi:hypothetical protein